MAVNEWRYCAFQDPKFSPKCMFGIGQTVIEIWISRSNPSSFCRYSSWLQRLRMLRHTRVSRPRDVHGVPGSRGRSSTEAASRRHRLLLPESEVHHWGPQPAKLRQEGRVLGKVASFFHHVVTGSRSQPRCSALFDWVLLSDEGIVFLSFELHREFRESFEIGCLKIFFFCEVLSLSKVSQNKNASFDVTLKGFQRHRTTIDSFIYIRDVTIGSLV